MKCRSKICDWLIRALPFPLMAIAFALLKVIVVDPPLKSATASILICVAIPTSTLLSVWLLSIEDIKQ